MKTVIHSDRNIRYSGLKALICFSGEPQDNPLQRHEALGPNQPSTWRLGCCGAARRTGHWSLAWNFQSANGSSEDTAVWGSGLEFGPHLEISKKTALSASPPF